MSKGKLQESLSQAMVVGIVLVGRLGVVYQIRAPCQSARGRRDLLVSWARSLYHIMLYYYDIIV